MVYYGIHLLRPAYFYVAALAICSTVSLGIGGSWTTVGTIGVGLMGLATMVGVSPAITAGASFSRRHHGRPSAAASGVGRCQEFNGSWLASLRQRHLVGEAKGYHVHTGVTEIDRLLSRGSMASMLETLWIIIGAVTVWHSARRIQTALKTHQSAP